MKTIEFYTPSERMPEENDHIYVVDDDGELVYDEVKLSWLKVDDTGKWDGDNSMNFTSLDEHPDGYILGTCSYVDIDETMDDVFWCYMSDFDNLCNR
jgi:hypothetical protein